MYPETSTHRAELLQEEQDALKLPRSPEKDKILNLISRLISAEKERNEYFERIQTAMSTGRIRDAFGYEILICSTPKDAHVVIDYHMATVIGNFDDEYDANIWARNRLKHTHWVVAPLSSTR